MRFHLIPELDQSVVESAFPVFYPHFLNLATAAKKLCDSEAQTEHQDAVLCQCTIIWDRFVSLLLVACAGYGPSALALYRTLAEIAAGTIYLAENADKLELFLDAGRYVYCEQARTNCEMKVSEETADEWRNLQTKYPNGFKKAWHELDAVSLFHKVGFDAGAKPREFYTLIYPETSNIAHGGPLLLTYWDSQRGWCLALKKGQWSDDAKRAAGSAYILLIHSLERISTILKMGVSEDIAALDRESKEVARTIRDTERAV